MKQPAIRMFIIGLAALVVGNVSAALTWTGRYSQKWNTTEYNWIDGQGNEALFTAGADVLFDDTAAETTVFVDATLTAGTVVVSNTAAKTYVITNTVKTSALTQIAAFRKKGEGKLVFSAGSGATVRDFGAGLFVEKGEACFDGPNQLQYFTDKPAGVLFAGTNATLRFGSRNMFNTSLTDPVTTPISIVHGSLVVEDKPDVNGHLKIGPVSFDNGTFDYSGLKGYSQYLGVMTWSGKLAFTGDAPYEILQSGMSGLGNSNTKLVHLWSGSGTEFEVADITGDGAEDLTLGVLLVDQCLNSKADEKSPGCIVKTGAGTLAVTNAGNRFSGDIEVREGVLQVGPNWQLNGSNMTKTPADCLTHWIGGLTNANRKIVVKTGASLYFPNRNCFGTQSGITNLMEDVNLTLVFDGGTFTNYDGQGFLLPNVTFANGGSIAPGKGAANYGRFMVKERFRVTGTAPFEWQPSDDAKSSASKMGYEALSLNGEPENVFEIDDVTGDAEADATFGVPFIIGFGYFRTDTAFGNHLLNDWQFGFTKTGQGTMRIAAAKYQNKISSTPSGFQSRGYNGDSKINEGTLQVDGDISLSDTVRIAAGAFLAGTGIVNNVSIAAGGGLRVPFRQTQQLRIQGDLSVGESPEVDVIVPDGQSVRDVKANILSVAGTVTGGENFAGAVVKVDGVPVPNARVEFSGGVLRVRYCRGTSVYLR